MKKETHIGKMETDYSKLPEGALNKALKDWSRAAKKLKKALKNCKKTEEQLQNGLDDAEKNLNMIMTVLRNCQNVKSTIARSAIGYA
jgi:septal ring factor EnvC (AmiA/AmiB activator)